MSKEEDEEREKNYEEFIEEPNLRRKAESEVLRPGKVKAIHLEENARPAWDNIEDKPDLYTQDEIDAMVSRSLTNRMWFFSIMGS